MADIAMTATSPAAPVLLDVTRLVARSWTGRQPTGIDRVCDAYLRHFRPRARAVVQHRGVIRVLPGRESEDLFHLLDAPTRGRRAGLARLLSSALLAGSGRPPVAGQAYLNAGDTDFDLPAHHRWASESGVRPFYVVHDLIPTLHPEFSRPHAVRRHRGRVRGALAHGAGLIMGTQAVRKELEAYALAENLRLPPLLVAPFAGADLVHSQRPVRGKEDPFFLCVGTIEPRKNHRLLFAVWERLAARLGAATPKLVLVGQSGPMTGDLLAPLAALHPHVEHRRVCSDEELADLMCRARALLMPSFAEGFGLPVVEALQSGTPVIASTLPVFDEIGQGVVRLVDPCDIAGWEEAIIAATLPDRSTAGPAPGFVPPHWPDHFEAVERFLACGVSCTRSSSQRVLAA